jgi:hypothetical protein
MNRMDRFRYSTMKGRFVKSAKHIEPDSDARPRLLTVREIMSLLPDDDVTHTVQVLASAFYAGRMCFSQAQMQFGQGAGA